jgi:hypothetical protein
MPKEEAMPRYRKPKITIYPGSATFTPLPKVPAGQGKRSRSKPEKPRQGKPGHGRKP